MRIVGGLFGGRRFNPPAGIPARPTTELAKEGLFNMLANIIDLEGATALDLFAGTGSIGYELLSRGADRVTMVERDRPSFQFIKKTVMELGVTDKTELICHDAFKFVKQCTVQFNFIFADPPYAMANMDEVPYLIFERNLLAPAGLFVLEHTTHNNYELHPYFYRVRNYGTSIFTFFTQPSN